MTTITTTDSIHWPHSSVQQAWESGIYDTGVTEPWVQQLVANLLVATNSRTVLELGCYLGLTTSWMACALESLGGGMLIGVELEPERAQATEEQLSRLPIPHVSWHIHTANTLDVLPTLDPASIDFAWVDDTHTPAHVHKELEWLVSPTTPSRRRMKPDGLVTMHDVDGPLGLAGVCRAFGGLPLRLPHPGPAGGIGIIQTNKYLSNV